MLGLTAVGFGLAWWLGLYLIARDPSKPVLRRAGIGLLGYALAIACSALAGAQPSWAAPLTALRAGLVCVPAVAWTGVLVRLLPDDSRWRDTVDRWWRRVLVPASGVAVVALVAAGGFRGAPLLPAGPLASTLAGPLVPALAAILVLTPLIAGFALLLASGPWRRYDAAPVPASRQQPAPGRLPVSAGGLVLVATLLLGLGVVALLLGVNVLPAWLTLTGIGLDLVLLGVVVAVADAFDEGETLRPDMRRSAVTATLTGGLFGGQIAVAMLFATRTPAMVALLFGGIAAAVTVQALANPLHRLLDRVSFPGAGSLRHQRAELRDVAEALPRRADTHALAGIDDAEFVRLTRRALSHYGDLGRLVTSPLTGLPAVDVRLAARGAPDRPLERATELKSLLLESITRLKPPGGEFGTTDEWRHYNALYYPYVVGLRPYSQRARHAGLPATARTALRWFQTQVPERTLHNWQNAAARLVAVELRARGFDRV